AMAWRPVGPGRIRGGRGHGAIVPGCLASRPSATTAASASCDGAGQVGDQADADVVVAAGGVERARAAFFAPARTAGGPLPAVAAAVGAPRRYAAIATRGRELRDLARVRQAIVVAVALAEPAGVGVGVFPRDADHRIAAGLFEA